MHWKEKVGRIIFGIPCRKIVIVDGHEIHKGNHGGKWYEGNLNGWIGRRSFLKKMVNKKRNGIWITVMEDTNDERDGC